MLVAGLGLLFAPDVVLPAVTPAFPSDALWIGQLLGAAWIGLGGLNWLHRSALLGGIYTRGVVYANAVTYFVSALVMLRAGGGVLQRPAGLVAGMVAALGALTYGWLLFRGPAEHDLAEHRRRSGA